MRSTKSDGVAQREGVDADPEEEARARAAELRETAELLNRTQAMAHTGSWVRDIATGDVRWSDEQCRIFGYEPGAAKPTFALFVDALHPEDRDRVLDVLNRAVETGAPYAERFRIRRPDGSVRTVVARGELKRTADGRPLRMIGTVQDITERSRIEGEIERERDFARNLIDAAPAIIVLLDARGTIQHVNPYFEQLTGYRLDEVRGKDWFATFLPERDRERIGARFQDSLRGAPARGRVGPIVLRSGEERQIEWYGRLIRDEQGNASALLVTGQDVTERWRAEAVEREHRLRVQRILDSMFAFVGLFTPEGVLLEANRAPLEAAGLAREEVIGKPFWETYWWSYSPAAQEQVRDALRRAARGDTAREDFRVRVRNGAFIVIDATFGPIRDADGRVVEIVGSGVDVSERKRAEAELGLIMDNAPALIARYDDQLRLLYANRRYCEFFGVRPEEALGRTAREIIGPEAYPQAYEQVKAVLQGEAVAYQGVRRTQDGAIRYVDASAVPEFDGGGRVRGFLTIAVDSTARQRAEHALKASEARLKEAQRIARVGSWELDLAADVLDWSDEIFRIFEIDQARFGASYEAFLAAVHPDDRQAVNRAYKDSVENRTPYEITHRLLMPDGRLKFVTERCETEYDAGGRPLRSIGTVQDVTDRVLAEEARLIAHTAIDASISGIAMVGKDGRVTYVNRALLELWRLERPEQALGRPAIEFWAHPEEAGQVMQRLRGGGSWQGELRARRDDGSGFDAQVVAHAVADSSGRVLCVMGSFLDISDRKRAETALRDLNARLEQRVAERTAALAAANKELETFTYSVSHDLKAPLRGIEGYSRLLLEDYAERLDEQGRGFLHKVRRATRQMNALIDDLLAYSRMEQRPTQARPLDVAELARSLVAERAEEARTRDTTVLLAMPETAVLSCDAEGLALALRNLLDNALKFSRGAAHPEIEIGAREQGRSWLLWVRDNGIGFDMRYHDRIFGIFQRLNRTEDFPGTGVGLAIVRRAMERIRGRAWAEATPGEGATFYLEIPK